MKGVNLNEWREMTPPELRTKQAEFSQELFALRIRHSLGQLENPCRLSFLRKQIARVKTILAEKTKGGID